MSYSKLLSGDIRQRLVPHSRSSCSIPSVYKSYHPLFKRGEGRREKACRLRYVFSIEAVVRGQANNIATARLYACKCAHPWPEMKLVQNRLFRINVIYPRPSGVFTFLRLYAYVYRINGGRLSAQESITETWISMLAWFIRKSGLSVQDGFERSRRYSWNLIMTR